MSRKDVKKGKRRLARAGVGERGELVKRQCLGSPTGVDTKPFHHFRRYQPLERIAQHLAPLAKGGFDDDGEALRVVDLYRWHGMRY